MFGLLIVVAIFVFAIPKFADSWRCMGRDEDAHADRSAVVTAATVFNLFTYWLANQAALLARSQSAVVTQTEGRRWRTRCRRAELIAVGVTYAT